MTKPAKLPLKIHYSCGHEETTHVSQNVHILYRLEGSEQTRSMQLNTMCFYCQESAKQSIVRNKP